MSNVVLTGATGFLGGVILGQLVEETPHEVTVLIRAADDAAAEQRLVGVCERLWGSPEPPRPVRAIVADLERARLGIAPDRSEELAEWADLVIHSAAAISFDLPLREARRTNVGGAANVALLAEAADAHLVHISTAYVAGDRQGLIREDDPVPSAGFRNSYERSKAEAEAVVRGAAVRSAIVRPSIIVGESGSGWTSAFNVIYGPLRAMASGRLGPIPASGDGLVDLVPVDLVAAAAVAAAGARARGAFHVASGESVVSGRDLCSMVAAELDVPEIGFDPEAGIGLGSYTSYLDVACRFSTERTSSELGIDVPPVGEYLPQLLSYAREARWGKRSIPWRAADLRAAA